MNIRDRLKSASELDADGAMQLLSDYVAYSPTAIESLAARTGTLLDGSLESLDRVWEAVRPMLRGRPYTRAEIAERPSFARELGGLLLDENTEAIAEELGIYLGEVFINQLGLQWSVYRSRDSGDIHHNQPSIIGKISCVPHRLARTMCLKAVNGSGPELTPRGLFEYWKPALKPSSQ